MEKDMQATHSTISFCRESALRLSGLLLLLGVAACAPSVEAGSGNAVAGAATPPVASEPNLEIWPKLSSPIARDEALEARIQDLLATMTVEEKVGQIVQGDLGSTTPEDVRKYRLGSILAGGNSDPGGRYNATAAEWLALADDFYRASVDTSGGSKAIPVLMGIDAVHGHNNVVGATLFPHNIALGAADDPDLVRQIAKATAIELRTTGFEWTFAPTVTVPRDDRWGRTYEGYSENQDLVARYATAVVEGLQGKVGSADFLDATHVVASSKHFIGDGGTTDGKDKGNTEVTEAELREVHGAGHIAALQAGTQTVMASFSSWNGKKMHGNKYLLTDVLKERMAFDGFVVGDWNGHGEVPGCTNDDCPAALLAGLDMYMAPDTWRAVYTNTLAEVRSGVIPMQRLDDAVTRILRVKFRTGLFEAGLPSQRGVGGKFELLASPAHRQLARQAVRKSLVLLKNNKQLLPLDPHASVLVAGDGADNIGKQAGGWTLSWQGTGTTPADFPNAESIWSGIKAAINAAGGKAILSVDGDYKTRPDVAIVVFGENPYAEFIGDIPNLAYRKGAVSSAGQQADLALLRRLKAAGIPVVAVFLSGRPLWVNEEINASDAFVAAWLPGSEGGGVADVLFQSVQGKAAFDFVGKLPFSWPKTASQGPLNVGQENYDPQFAFGYGLSYQRPNELPLLSEESGVEAVDGDLGLYFGQGRPAQGWGPVVAAGDAKGVTMDKVPFTSLAQLFDFTATDHKAQEDAWRLHWHGGGLVRFTLQAEQAGKLEHGSNGPPLVMTLRVDEAPANAVDLGIVCGPACAGRIPFQATLAGLAPGSWTRVAIPLKCFEAAGANLGKVTGILELSTVGPMELSVSRVALEDDYDQIMACPNP
jgi:beta-glucosidase